MDRRRGTRGVRRPRGRRIRNRGFRQPAPASLALPQRRRIDAKGIDLIKLATLWALLSNDPSKANGARSFRRSTKSLTKAPVFRVPGVLIDSLLRLTTLAQPPSAPRGPKRRGSCSTAGTPLPSEASFASPSRAPAWLKATSTSAVGAATRSATPTTSSAIARSASSANGTGKPLAQPRGRGIYGHLDVEDLRAALDKLPELGPNWVQTLKPKSNRSPKHRSRTQSLKLNRGGRCRIRTCDPCRVNRLKVVGRPTQALSSPRNH